MWTYQLQFLLFRIESDIEHLQIVFQFTFASMQRSNLKIF